jgi:hypothetical protein
MHSVVGSISRAMVYTGPLTCTGVWDAIPMPPPEIGTYFAATHQAVLKHDADILDMQ